MDYIDRLLVDIMKHTDPKELVEQTHALADIEKWADFDSFEAACRFCCSRFSSAGMDVDILRFPADGVTRTGTYTSSVGFRTRGGSCAIVEKDGSLTVLGDRLAEPNTTVVGTGNTPPEGLIAEIVYVPGPEQARGLDFRGKVMFTDMDQRKARDTAIAGGAAAVISSFTTIKDHDAQRFVKWINDWDLQPYDGWLPTKGAARQNLPGISISPEKGMMLLGRLRSEPGLKAKIVIDSEYFDGRFPAFWAECRGEEAGPSAILTGHLFEAGVWDSAAGVMTAWGASLALSRLMAKRGRRFRRGWCHFHGQEVYGVLALHAFQPERLRGLLAHLNIDGGGMPEYPVLVAPGLAATPGFGEFLMRLIARRASELSGHPVQVTDRFLVNCTVLAEPALGGIPTAHLNQGGDSWHISRDRREYRPASEQAVLAGTLLAGAWLLFAADAGPAEAAWLLGEEEKDMLRRLKAGDCPDTEIYLSIKRREVETLLSVLPESERERFAASIEETFYRVRTSGFESRELSVQGSAEERARAASLKPRTVVPGPAVAMMLGSDDLKELGQPKWNERHLAFKSWADGTRTVEEITRLVAYGASPKMREFVTLGYALRFFDAYAKAGLVTLE